MSKIVSYKAKTESILSNLKDLNKANSWEELSDIERRLSRETPTIMFYGIYNAGKSTLLNAIFGQEVASMADIPETKKVTAYDWNGYELYDTPGINGPKKDQILSQSELIKHDIILFVIDDSDSFDNKIVSEEIVKIIASNKPLVIVMNNKQTIAGIDDEDGIAKRGKLLQNIQTVGLRENLTNIEDKYEFMMVNANTALRARLEEKKLLLKNSNIEELEYLILRKLKSQDGFRFLSPVLDMIEKQIDVLRSDLTEQIQSKGEQRLQTLIQDLHEQRNLLLKNIKSKIKLELNITKKEILKNLLNEEEIEGFLEELNQKIESIIKRELNHVMEETKIEISQFFIDFEKIEMNRSESLKIINKEALTKTEDPGNLSNKIVKSTIDDESKEDDIKKILSDDIKKILSSIILISRVPKPIPTPIILTVVVTVVNMIGNINKLNRRKKENEERIEKANEKQNQYMYQKKQAIQNLRSQLDGEFMKIEQEVFSGVDEMIFETIVHIIKQLEEELHLEKIKSNKTYEKLSLLENLHNQVMKIRIEIDG